MSRPKNRVWKYIQFLTLHKRISSLHKTWLSLQHICALKAHLYYVPVRLLLLNAWIKDKSLYFFFLLNSISWNTDKSIPFQNVFYNSEQLYVHSSFIWPGNTTDRGCGWWRMLPFNALIRLSYFSVFLQLAAQRSLLRNILAAQTRSKKSQVAMGE